MSGPDIHRPAFIITIDTEGDDLWSKPRTITTKNADVLPRFQALCEAYRLRPTYLVSYEMARARAFEEFGRDIVRRQTGEIGMHLHAWNTPPLVSLTADDFAFQPYLTEYRRQTMKEKIAVLTDVLEDGFGVQMVSHRAGRWGFNEAYARLLVERGYRVDCSVTPYGSWKHHPGDPKGSGGPDYSGFPCEAYFVDLDDIRRPGASSLLEVPVSIVPAPGPSLGSLRRRLGNRSLARRALDRYVPSVYWLRPNGRNRAQMLSIVRQAVAEKKAHVEFMLHSSELMPGGSPTFLTQADVQGLYRDLEPLFSLAAQTCEAATLQEYYESALEDHGQAGAVDGSHQMVTGR